jgi:hypothetical protein
MNKFSCRTLFFLALFQVLSLSAAGPDFISLKFLQIPVGAGPSAMEGSATADVLGPLSMFYNPAGVSMSGFRSAEVSLHHLEYFQNVRNESVTAGFRLAPEYVVGIGVSYLYASDMSRTAAAETVSGFSDLGKYAYYDLVFIVCNSFALSKGFSAGLNVKYVRENIDTWSASTVAFDAGICFRFAGLKYLSFGAVVQNLGLPAKYSDVKNSIPALVRAGLSFQSPVLLQMVGVKFNLDMENTFSGNLTATAGLETGFKDTAFLRAGYSLSLDGSADNSMAFGAGIAFDRFRVDYSLSLSGSLGNNHRFSAGVRF